MVEIYTPDRGDFIWLDFNPQTGKEQAKTRPALVLSPLKYNRASSLALVCPVTSKYKGWGFEIALPNDFKVQGSILVDQLKSLDYSARNAKFIEKCPEAIMNDVLEKARLLLAS
jgi:mRNA interferase MazF